MKKEPWMTVITTPPAGTFWWPELCSVDAAASKKFYASLFGWDPEDISMPEGIYTLFKLGGHGVGTMYQMEGARKQAGVRPHWNPYIAVADADSTSKQAASPGGKILTSPFDTDGDVMANLQDPTGANFSIWQAKKPPPPIRINEVGSLCWTELYTRDA
jgi:uncharacterized protein